MKKLTLSLVALVFTAFISSASAATVCGISLGDPVGEMDAQPIGPAIHLGAITEIAIAPGVCQGVQIGAAKTSPVDGFTEVLVTMVANDHGKKMIATDFFSPAFQGKKSFLIASGQLCDMPIHLLPGGGLKASCFSVSLAALNIGSSGP